MLELLSLLGSNWADSPQVLLLPSCQYPAGKVCSAHAALLLTQTTIENAGNFSAVQNNSISDLVKHNYHTSFFETTKIKVEIICDICQVALGHVFESWRFAEWFLFSQQLNLAVFPGILKLTLSLRDRLSLAPHGGTQEKIASLGRRHALCPVGAAWVLSNTYTHYYSFWWIKLTQSSFK